MKKLKLLLIVIFFIGSFSIKAQQIVDKGASFRVVSNMSFQSNDYFITALSAANMESYRLRDKEVIINFKEGVRCVILPATALVALGENIDINIYKEDFPKEFVMPFFSVNANGQLLAEYPKKLK